MLGKNNFNFLPLLLGICLSGIILLQEGNRTRAIEKAKNIDYFQQEERLNSVVNLEKITPSFGFDNLKADWLFLNFIQYLGDKPAREITGYSLTSEYFEAVVEYDVKFLSAHLILAQANTMYGGQPEKTVELLNKILREISAQNSADLYYFLSFNKAYDELLLLGDKQAAQASYEKVKQWLEEESITSLKNYPIERFPRSEFASSELHFIESQIMAWSTILPNVKDRTTRREIKERIASLQSQRNSI